MIARHISEGWWVLYPVIGIVLGLVKTKVYSKAFSVVKNGERLDQVFAFRECGPIVRRIRYAFFPAIWLSALTSKPRFTCITWGVAEAVEEVRNRVSDATETWLMCLFVYSVGWPIQVALSIIGAVVIVPLGLVAHWISNRRTVQIIQRKNQRVSDRLYHIIAGE